MKIECPKCGCKNLTLEGSIFETQLVRCSAFIRYGEGEGEGKYGCGTEYAVKFSVKPEYHTLVKVSHDE